MRIIKRKKQKWTTLTRKVCHSSNFKTPIKSFINDSLLKNLAYTSIDTFTWEVKWTHTGLRFQTSVKTSSVHMKFHFGYISKRYDILMNLCRHFIPGSIYMIFFHPKWNFIPVKMTNMKSMPALSFRRTCALNAASKESPLINFV